MTSRPSSSATPTIIRPHPCLNAPRHNNTDFIMKSTVSVSEGQNSFPALVKAAEKGSVVTVTRHDSPVA